MAIIFMQTAESYPQKTALSYAGRDISYAELERSARSVARNLNARGIGRGDFVCVWLTRTAELHIAILGVLFSGAAYVPIDADAPIDRVGAIIEDCSAKSVITNEITSQQISVLSPLAGKQSLVGDVLHFESAESNAPFTPPALPDDAAYVIYTSGSTGTPKGITVSHRSISHFLRSENSILGVCFEDRVWQGCSPAFDMWLEECFIAYLVGATLVMATPDDLHSLDKLGERLRAERITVLNTVPTLAALIADDVPCLRLMNFGGEACPSTLIDRYARTGRRLFNGYGPTETTVGATLAECVAGKPMTIGKPIPNYTAYVVDGKLQPVTVGKTGELLIGGIGVSMGYRNRDALTLQKFIPNPWNNGGGVIDPVLYRTGDAVSVNNEGELVFHGRIDTQVKLRGFRIELEEIEAVLSACEGIATAAAHIQKDASGIDQIVAFVVVKKGNHNYQKHCRDSSQREGRLGASAAPAASGGTIMPDMQVVRKTLHDKLPPYMIPAHIEIIAQMPRLAGGKIDRKRLPVLKSFAVDEIQKPTADFVAPRSDLEKQIASAMSDVFSGRNISITADFFTDYGGHSLLAAALVSILRKDAKLAHISIADIYRQRTAENLAKMLGQHFTAKAETKTRKIHRPSYWQYILCACGQVVGLFFVFGIIGSQLLMPFLTYAYADEYFEDDIWSSIFVTLGVSATLPIIFTILVNVLKKLVIGKYKEGDYPLYGGYYLRWWFVGRLKDTIPSEFLVGTPFYPAYLRLMGAKIGRKIDFSKIQIDCEDLLEIGDNSSISTNSLFDNATIEDGYLRLRKITIGAHVHIGTGAIIGGGVRLEDWVEIGDLTAISADSEYTIASHEIWNGSPARKVGMVDEKTLPLPAEQTNMRKMIAGTLYLFLFACLSVFSIAPILPGLVLINYLDRISPPDSFFYLVVCPLIALSYILLFGLEFFTLRWLVLGRLPAGDYAVNSHAYIRKWFVDQLGDIALGILHPIYATLYMPHWYRLLGAKIGKRAEISTASAVTHHLLQVDDEAFIADAVVLGDPQIRHGWLTLKTMHIGKRSFIGNAAVVPDGSVIPDASLIGVLSLAPSPQEAALVPNSTWLGIPAKPLPTRERFSAIPESLTFTPKKRQITGRLLVESLRVAVPYTVILMLVTLLVYALYDVFDEDGVLMSIFAFPFLYVGLFGVPAVAVVVALKWICIGRYKSGQWPMWTPFVWLSEAVTSTYEALAVPLFLNHLKGTPFLPFFLRFLGVKIGSMAMIDTTDFTEFDMIQIKDRAVLQDSSGLQTHLFEDRVMKIGQITIGKNTNLGAGSIVLYNAELQDNSSVGALSLIMKGETIPANSSWQGSPAEPV